MSLERCLGSLPSGFQVERRGRGVLAARREWVGELVRAGFGPDDDQPLQRSDLSGRSSLFEIVLTSESLLVRRFRHGGVLRGIGGNRFAGPERVFRELVLSEMLAESGIPTPPVVGARARRMSPFGWRMELLTRRIGGAIDGLRALERVSSAGPGAMLRARLFQEAGKFVARLHGAGLFHADLTPRNLLLDEGFLRGGEARFWVLDLDRSRIQRPLSSAARIANLARLARFLLRRRDRGACRFSRADLLRFLRGYAAGSGGAFEPTALWRGIELRLGRSSWIHRLGWILEEWMGEGPEARDGRGAGQRVDK